MQTNIHAQRPMDKLIAENMQLAAQQYKLLAQSYSGRQYAAAL